MGFCILGCRPLRFNEQVRFKKQQQFWSDFTCVLLYIMLKNVYKSDRTTELGLQFLMSHHARYFAFFLHMVLTKGM